MQAGMFQSRVFKLIPAGSVRNAAPGLDNSFELVTVACQETGQEFTLDTGSAISLLPRSFTPPLTLWQIGGWRAYRRERAGGGGYPPPRYSLPPLQPAGGVLCTPVFSWRRRPTHIRHGFLSSSPIGCFTRAASLGPPGTACAARVARAASACEYAESGRAHTQQPEAFRAKIFSTNSEEIKVRHASAGVQDPRRSALRRFSRCF